MRIRSAVIALTICEALLASLGMISEAPSPRTVQASPGQTWPAPREAKNLEIIGHNDLNQIIFNTSEVWYGKGIAYVAYRCSHQRNALAKGTSIVDVHDPTKPVVLSATAPFSGGFADDVRGLTDLHTDFYQGDLLVEPHDFCNRATPQVTRFWNVSNPAKPVLLSTLLTGDGVHNVYAFTRMEGGKQKAYVILAAPFADTADNTQYGWEDKDLDADFAIVDATDPTKPEIVGKFNLHQAVPNLPAGSIFQHDTWANKAGTMAYGAYWDAGMVFLDISDVRNIKYVNHWFYSDKARGTPTASFHKERGLRRGHRRGLRSVRVGVQGPGAGQPRRHQAQHWRQLRGCRRRRQRGVGGPRLPPQRVAHDYRDRQGRERPLRQDRLDPPGGVRFCRKGSVGSEPRRDRGDHHEQRPGRQPGVDGRLADDDNPHHRRRHLDGGWQRHLHDPGRRHERPGALRPDGRRMGLHPHRRHQGREEPEAGRRVPGQGDPPVPGPDVSEPRLQRPQRLRPG